MKKEPKHKDAAEDRKLIKSMCETKAKPMPYDKRQQKNTKRAMASTEKSVKPVAKDTNKTRRKIEKPTKEGTRSPKAGSPNPRGVNRAGK